MKTKVEHTMLVATELTTEDLLEIFIKLASELTYKLQRTEKERDEWKHTFEMYDNAWTRETKPFGYLAQHKHRIDGFVITQKEIVRRAVQHRNQENSRLNGDPFWNVPDISVKEESSEVSGL